MASRKTRNDLSDALTLVTPDHANVRVLFAKFAAPQESGSTTVKLAVVKEICDQLTILTALEQEIFYPAVRRAIQNTDSTHQAMVEHACAKEFIGQLNSADANDSLYNFSVTVLGEQIDHHIDEEESNMFVQARMAKMDTAALGIKMLKREQAVMKKRGLTTEMQSDMKNAEAPVVKKAVNTRS